MDIPHTSESYSARTDVGQAPAVSVVMPCRNERAHIEEAVHSVLAQRDVDGDFEVLVVDGQSDDGTRDVLNRMQAAHPRLRVLDNPQRITAVAMNRGVERSRGGLVAILGAHTLYPPDYLALCQSLLSEHPDAGCVGGTIESKGTTPFGRAVAFAMSHPVGVGNARHRYPDYEGYAEGACFPVFRREELMRTGLYDPALVRNQDDDLNYRFRQAGGRVFISHRARCTYFVRETAGALWDQYFQYGLWRLRVLRKHGEVASWRQLVPVVLWGWILAALLTSPFVAGSVRSLMWAPVFAYVVLLLTTLLLCLPALGAVTAMRVPVAMGTMHFAYALGFVRAFLRGSAS